MESYNSERARPSSTRLRLERIRDNGINCVETNVFRNEQSGGGSQGIKNYDVLNLLLRNMPLLKRVIAHGKTSHQALDSLEVPASLQSFKLRHFREECYSKIDMVCEEILAA